MNENMKSAEQEFLKEIGHDKQPEILQPTPEAGKPEVKEEGEKPPRENRELRRLRKQFEETQKMNIALNERVKVLSELGRETKKSDNSDIDPRLVAAFGTTDEGKAASKLLAEMLEDNARKAEERALEKLRAEREAAKQEEVKESDFIDTQLEAVEDKFGVDLTSNTRAAKELRNQYIDLLEKYSPKDSDGNIVQYADFESVFETLQDMNTRKSPETSRRQREVASRSMTQTGQVANRAPEQPARINFQFAEKMLDKFRN